MIRFKTKRLVIRDHVESDKSALQCLLMDQNAMRYLPDIYCKTEEEVDRNLRTAIQEARHLERMKYYFAIEEREHVRYIGEIGFTRETDWNANGGIVNLGYFILPECWGNGYVTEAALAVIDFAFSNCNVHKITTGCLKENVASERVMQKCGMMQEAEFKKHVCHEGRWKDRVEYRLLHHEWEALHSHTSRAILI